ncbi:unnamed protein product [Rotaria socialis]|uniref:Uncharacterized protein n=1 Tax=Rotaria socialis TaxID=392032 RepID=A0A821BFY5_9BILA|nr:unnamed protein product [Rotaria socialis]CAF4591547.1 unnamed protein product [Rotaria socialis]
MGSVVSQANLDRISTSLPDAAASLNQIIRAFDNEFLFQSQQNDHILHHRQPTPILRSSITRKEEHHRSKSSDPFQPQEHQNSPQARSTSIKRRWQCQLCHTINESDALLCTECGSNKINVYIPCMDHIDIISTHNDNQNNLLRVDNISSKNHHESRGISMVNQNSLEKDNGRRRSVLIAHKHEADEHIALKHVDKLVQMCLFAQDRFKDKHFPASSDSLYINGKSLSKFTLTLLPDQQQINLKSSSSFISSSPSLSADNIQWLRPDKIIPQEWIDNVRQSWAVFRDPNPNDVLQGALGDCWFITALSVLAEQPEYLMRVLVTKQFNSEGIYCVRLCKDGEWTQVLVDDRLPCTFDKKLAYSQAHRKQLWVPLIEKALAKLNGSYEAIIAGRCCEGLATVTGSPCETLILGRSNNPDDKNVDYDRLWSKLLHARSKRFLMCAMCCNNLISKEEFEKYGLLNIHAYSLQDLAQSKDKKHKLVKLRNPWGGTYRWTGDWSDNSRLWSENPDLNPELLNTKLNKRDGVFWMPFVSFVRYFECVDICKLRHDWYEVRDSSNFYPMPKMMQAYSLIVSHATELDITLHRKISKHLRVQRSDVSLCLAIINIEEQPNGTHRIYSIPIISQRDQHKFIATDGFLQPGTYVILPLLFNQVNKHLDNTEFTVAIHSSRVIDIQRLQFPLRMKREFLIKLCIFHGEPVCTSKSTDKNDNQFDGITIYELKKYWDGLIVLVENRHPSKYVHFHFRCTVSQNTLISRKDSQRELFDVIPPNYRQIITTISRKSSSSSFTIGHDFQYLLSSQNVIKQGEGIKQKHWPTIDESQSSDDIHLPQSISSAKRK